MNLCKQETPRVLLVEGPDDCHVIMALCAAFDVPETFGIYECGSDAGVVKRLNALILSPERPLAIGIVLDADASFAGRWQVIQRKLAHYSYRFPEPPEPGGTVLEGTGDEPRLGIWIMPDHSSPGMLEDFCAHLAEPKSLEFAAECVDHAHSKGLTTFKAAHRSKAVIHTYLAWQDEPGRPMGQAITAQALQAHQPMAARFVEWLRRLFVEPVGPPPPPEVA